MENIKSDKYFLLTYLPARADVAENGKPASKLRPKQATAMLRSRR